MKERNLFIYNTALFILLMLLTAGVQTAIWPHLSPISSSPALWLFPVIYFSIHKSLVHSVVFSYLSVLFLHPFTGMHFGALLTLHLCVVLFSIFLKTRVFWSAISYYLILCSLNVTLVFIALAFITRLTEPHHIYVLAWKEWLLTLFLVPPIGALYYGICRFIDHLAPTPQEGVTES